MEQAVAQQSSTGQPDPGRDFQALARDAYTASTTYFDSSIRKQVEAAIRQFQGVHPIGSKYFSDPYRTRSRLFRPKTRAMVRKAEAVAAEALFATADVISIKSVDDNNPRKSAGAALMKELMAYRLDKSIPWFLVACGAYQDALVTGAVVSYQYWQYDPKKKVDRPYIELMALENFRFDPGASWLDPVNTSPYNIRRVPMFVKDVKARMRSGKWTTYSDAELLTAASRMSDTTRLTRERGRTDSTQNPTSITNFTIVWVHQIVMDIDGEDMVWWCLDGDYKLLTTPKPIAQVWRHGKRPFVMGYAIIETHKSYPDGAVGITRDVQAEINEIANQRIDNVKFAMNKRYFVRRNGQVDLRSISRNVPGSSTLMTDTEKDVKVVDTKDVTSSAYQEQDRLNLDFDDVSGTFSPSSVQSNRHLNETVGGMKLLSVNTNQVGAYQLRTFCETWAEPVLRQVALLESFYETDETILQLAGQQADLKQWGIDEVDDDLMEQEVNLRIDVGMGATNPQEQVNNFMLAMRSLKELLADGVLEKYGMDIGEVIKELFGKLGYRDGKRFYPNAKDPALLAAESTIAQLQQELAQKVSPEMVAAQVRKLDAEIEALGAKQWDTRMSALEKAVRSFFAAAQTAQVIAAVPVLAPVADATLDGAAVMSGNEPTIGQVGPLPGGPAPGLTQKSVKDPRTGIEFNPGAAGAAAGDTSPQTPANPETGAQPAQPALPTLPAPGSPGTGANAGINTAEPGQ